MTKREFIEKHNDCDVRYSGKFGVMIVTKTDFQSAALQKRDWQNPKFLLELERERI